MNYRADLNCANALDSNPIFSSRNLHLDVPSDFYESFHNKEGTSTVSKASIATPRKLNQDLIQCFTHLRRLTIAQRELDKGDSNAADHIKDSDEVYLIERKLLEISNLAGSRSLSKFPRTSQNLFIGSRGIKTHKVI